MCVAVANHSGGAFNSPISRHTMACTWGSYTSTPENPNSVALVSREWSDCSGVAKVLTLEAPLDRNLASGAARVLLNCELDVLQLVGCV